MLLFQVELHLNESKEHKFAEIENEKSIPIDKRPGQTTIDAPCNKKAVAQARLKLLRTSYTLVMNPTMPLKQLKTLVKLIVRYN